MDDATHDALLKVWRSLPEGVRYPPVSEAQLRTFEAEFGPIPPGFRQFLAEFGGGVVGREWIHGICELPDTHRKFRREFGPPRGWSMADVFIIGRDGAGNPLGIERSSGRVLLEDHDFGGIHEVVASFEALLIAGLNGAEAKHPVAAGPPTAGR